MQPAHWFVEVLEQGLSPVEAICSLPTYEPLYIHRVSVEVYRAALRKAWRFFPVSYSKRLPGIHANLFQAATNNLQQLERWAREWPNWGLVTGPESGVFVLEVEGREGLASVLDFCGDDWNVLDTLRSMPGENRCISFAWPEGRTQISSNCLLGKGLRVFGEGNWVLVPPSPEPHGTQHTYLNLEAEAVAAPLWLLDRAFKPETADSSRPLPPCSALLNAWSNAVLVEATHD